MLRGRATFDAKRRSAKRVADYQKRVRLGDPLSLAEVVRDLVRQRAPLVEGRADRRVAPDRAPGHDDAILVVAGAAELHGLNGNGPAGRGAPAP